MNQSSDDCRLMCLHGYLNSLTSVSCSMAPVPTYRLSTTGIVEFRGTMTDCPDKLTTGVSLIVTLRVYMLPSAFRPQQATEDQAPSIMFNEGAETLDERSV